MKTSAQTSPLSISSPAFGNGESIPEKYTCEGRNVNPPLTIGNLPEGTKSLVLIVEDPDAPNGIFCHWLMWGIPPIRTIHENSAPGLQGLNSAGKACYTGPCPPSGTHSYVFKVYAIDTILRLREGIEKVNVEESMQGHILASGELTGVYKRSK